MNQIETNMMWLARERLSLEGIVLSSQVPIKQLAKELLKDVSKYTNEAQKNPKKFKQRFDRIGSVFKKYEPNLNPRMLTTRYIDALVVDPLQKDSFLALNTKKSSLFISYFDLAYGAVVTKGALEMVSLETNDISEAIRVVDESRGNNTELTEQVDTFLEINSRAKKLRELLLQDEGKGFVLLDEFVRFVKGENLDIPGTPVMTFQTPDLVIKAAEFVKTTYKAVYPFSVKFLTQ